MQSEEENRIKVGGAERPGCVPILRMKIVKTSPSRTPHSNLVRQCALVGW